MHLRFTLLLIIAAAMALPAPALGQSAGDEQYEDPLELRDPPPRRAPARTPRPSPPPPRASTPAAGRSNPQQAQVHSGPQAGRTEDLPRTGLPAGALAAAGAALLAAGTALRRAF